MVMQAAKQIKRFHAKEHGPEMELMKAVGPS